MALKVGELFATMNLKDEGFQKGLDDASKQLNNTSGSVMKGLAKFKLLEAGLSALGKGLTASINAGKAFETSMSQLAATMGTTVDQIGNLEAKAREMGASTKYTASQAAEGLNILAQAGLTASQQIASIDTVLDLASAGAMDMATSAGYIATAVKGWRDSFDNSAKYADIMAKGATMANTSVSQLGEAMSGIAATANQYNQGVESTAVAMLRLAEQGIVGSEAATGLQRVLIELYSSASNKKALEELGVTVYETSGEARDLNDVIKDLQAALSKLSAEERNQKISAMFGARGLRIFNAMAATSEETLTGFWEGISEASGSAAEQAATQIDNLEGDIAILESAVEGLQISVYKSMNGMLRTTVKAATGIVDAIHKAYDEGFTPENVSGIVGQVSDLVEQVASGIASKLPSIVKGLVISIPQLIKGAGNIAISLSDALFEAIEEAIGGLGAMLPQLAPILISSLSGLMISVGRGLAGIFDTVIGGIASGLGSDEIGTNLQQMLDKVLGTTNGTITAQIGINAEVDTQQAEEEITPKVTDALTGIFDGVKETLTNGILKDDAEATAAASEAVQAQIGELASNISTWEEAKIAAIKASGLDDGEIANEIAAVQEQANAMRESLDGAQTAAGEWLETYSEAPTKVVKDHMGELDEVVSSVSEVETQIGSLMDSLATETTVDEPEKSVGQQIVEDVIGTVDAEAVNGAFGGLGELMVTAINTGISSAIETVSSQDFAENLSAVGTAIIKGIVSAIAGVENAAADILGKITGVINTALSDEGLAGMLTTADTVAGNILDAINTGITTLSGTATSLTTAVVELILTGIKKITSNSFTGKLGTLATTILTGIGNAVKNSALGAAQVVNAIKGAIQGALTPANIKNAIGNVATLGADIIGAIGTAISGAANGATSLVEAVEGIFSTIMTEENLTAYTEALRGLGGKLVGALAEALGTVKDDAGGLGSAIIEAIGKGIQGAFNGGAAILGALTGVLKDALSEGKIKSILTNLGDLGTQILNAIGEGIRSAADGAINFIGAIGEMLKTAFGGEEGEGLLESLDLSGIGDTLIKAIVTAITKIGEKAGEIAKALGAAIGGVDWADAGADLGSLAQNLLTSLTTSIAGEDANFEAIMTAIGQGLGKAAKALVDFGKGLAGKLVEGVLDPATWASLGKAIFAIFKSIFAGAYAFLEEVHDEIVGEFDIASITDAFTSDDQLEAERSVDLMLTAGKINVENLLSGYTQAIEEGLSEGATESQKSAAAKATLFINEMLSNGIIEKAEDGSYAVTAAYKSLVENGLEAVGSSDFPMTQTLAEGLIDAFVSNLSSDSPEAAANAANSLKDLIDQGIALASEDENGNVSYTLNPEFGFTDDDGSLDAAYEAVYTALQEHIDKTASETVQEVSVPVSPEVTVEEVDTGTDSDLKKSVDAELAAQTMSAVVNVSATVNVTVSDSNALDVGTALGNDIGTGMTAAIEAAADGVADAASNLATQAKKSINGLYSKAYLSGQSFSRGFINGMSSLRDSVISTASQLATKAIDALKKGIKQGSPSKLTTESGNYFGEGFALGIANQIQAATDTARQLAQSAVAATTVRRFNVGPASVAAAEAGPSYMPIDYDRLADAMNERQQILSLDGKTVADIQARQNARASSRRNKSIELGYYGTTRRR